MVDAVMVCTLWSADDPALPATAQPHSGRPQPGPD